MNKITCYLLFSIFFMASCTPAYHIIIKNGKVYDGNGGPAYKADIGIKNDRIKTIGDLSDEKAKEFIDAKGLAVSPGFINMLSWANHSLLRDGRSMSDIKQGVTLEVFGEGSSMGPLNEEMKKSPDNPPWTTLGEYFDHIEEKGIATNIASYVGATTVRIHVLDYDNRKPTEEEMDKMVTLVKEAMEEGAMGLGTSLIYAPAYFADTEELIKLAKAAAAYDGIYISHMRSEGDKLLEAVDELLTIASEADIDAEIFHLKAAGEKNWPKLDIVLEKIDSARDEGINVAANMYSYTAASTGLKATMPPKALAGGKEIWLTRMKDPEEREKILKEMNSDSTEWENFLQMANDPANILLVDFDEDSLDHLAGRTLKEVAIEKNLSPAETILELILANGGDVGAVYFLMSEENVEKQLQLPYMTFGSDAGSMAAENNPSMTHPRAYGNFARVLGKYVREEKVLSLNEAIYRMTALSADKLKIKDRGRLAPGNFADIVVFDPKDIKDNATFKEPHQYAEGIHFVLVNGVPVIKNGAHTGATPGRAVRGPGYKKEISGTIQSSGAE